MGSASSFAALCLGVLSFVAAPDPAKRSLHEQVFGARTEREQTLPAELDLNGQKLDPIQIRLRGNRMVGVSLDELHTRLAEVLEAAALACLAAPKLSEHHDQSLLVATQCGIGLRYDAGSLTVHAEIEPKLRRMQALRIRPVRSTPNVIQDAKVSAFANVSAGLRRTSNEGGHVLEHGIGIHGALRAFGTTLEFDGLCAQGGCQPGLRSLVHDNPETLRRWRFGDLTEARAGGLYVPALRGFSVGTAFDLAPTQSFAPNLEAPLELRESANVEVLVNGRVVQRYDLAAGRYRISDVPLGFGTNHAELRITDAAGRVEHRLVEAFVDLALLEVDRVRTSFHVGQTVLPADTPTERLKPWVVATDYARGLGPRTTLSFGAASVPELGQHSLELGVTHAWGRWLHGTSLACVHSGRLGCKANWRWRLTDDPMSAPGWRHEGALEWRHHRHHELLGEPMREWDTMEAQWRSSRSLLDRHQLTIAARARWSADGALEPSIGAQWSSRLPGGLGLRIGVDHTRSSGTVDNSVNISIHWLFDHARQALQLELDSQQSSAGARWQWNRQRQRGGFGASIGATRNELGAASDGALAWRHERAGGDVSYAQLTTPSGSTSDMRMNLRTALVFADGVIGMTERVVDGFALIKPRHPRETGAVFVNPVADDYLASSLGPGPAVVVNLRAYEPRALALSLPELPVDRDPGDLFPVVQPGYKGGVLITAGAEPRIAVQAKVVDAKGEPISTVAGDLSPGVGGESVPVFVGRGGRLHVQGLRAGDWQLRLHTRPVRHHRLHIPDDASGTIDLGTLMP